MILILFLLLTFNCFLKIHEIVQHIDLFLNKQL